ncbi:hypothetical protein [Clostridium sp. UBA4548]|uniref:hypothetical protein n=1 Tax=Clostridium sp. UBA4548 TaxID=1946361 RepID=UPI0025C587E7|nr:hypothetical protein [Clostridium sp. UBA4548]
MIRITVGKLNLSLLKQRLACPWQAFLFIGNKIQSFNNGKILQRICSSLKEFKLEAL